MKRLLLLVVLAALLAGCTGPKPQVPEQDAQGRYVIHLTPDNQFEPRHAKVPAGAVLLFVADAAAHDVEVFRPGDSVEDTPAHGTNFQPVVVPGRPFEVQLDEAGTWTVFCHTHQEDDMRGKVTVEAASAEATEATRTTEPGAK